MNNNLPSAFDNTFKQFHDIYNYNTHGSSHYLKDEAKSINFQSAVTWNNLSKTLTKLIFLHKGGVVYVN